MKKCATCGELKEEDQFRHYYGGRKGLYTYCKTCETIEYRRRYLIKTGKQSEELTNIEELYKLREEAGLRQLNNLRSKKPAVASLVEEQLAAIRKDLG